MHFDPDSYHSAGFLGLCTCNSATAGPRTGAAPTVTPAVAAIGIGPGMSNTEAKAPGQLASLLVDDGNGSHIHL